MCDFMDNCFVYEYKQTLIFKWIIIIDCQMTLMGLWFLNQLQYREIESIYKPCVM